MERMWHGLQADARFGWQVDESVLYRFKGGMDAEEPTTGVVFDPAGNLWGTTLHGGDGPCAEFWGGSGCGTVYELTPNSRGGMDRARGTSLPWPRRG